MPKHNTPSASLMALHETQLNHYETMLNSGVAVAVPAALDHCIKNNLHVPRWLQEAALTLLCDLMGREKSRKRGRSCGSVSRCRQDMVAYARWDQVNVVRRKQRELREEVEKLRSLSNVPHEILEDREKLLAWVGSTLNRAFECAAMILEGTDAYASPEAMKRSYFQVQRNMASWPLRYHLLDPRVLHRLGTKNEIEVRPGRRLVPLYERTI